MKKTLSILLVIILVIAMPLSALGVSVEDFTDVSEKAWYYDAVKHAVDEGLFSGTAEDKFSPDQVMTRGMFVTVLGHYADVPDTYGRTQSTPFNDITQADYFFPFAVWASDNKIVSGVGGGRFDPQGKVTREQIATMIHNYAKFADFDLYSGNEYNSFPDSSKVSIWSVEAIKWAVTNKIIAGSEGKLNPQGEASRAQVAAIFYNMRDLGSSSGEITEPGLPSEPEPTDPTDPTDPTTPPTTSYERKTGKSAVDANGGYYDYDLANEIMDLIDELRVQNGAEPLIYHPQIQKWSDIRAYELWVALDKYGNGITKEQAHSRPDGSLGIDIGAGITAENCHWHTPRSDSAKVVVDSYYNSTGHRLAMLKESNRLGTVGVYIDGRGNLYTTHLFSNKPLYVFEMGLNN